MKKDRITEYFKYKGYLSAKAFARSLNISDSHITEIDGRAKNPTLISSLRSNPEFNDCNIDWIMTGEGKMLLDNPLSNPEIQPPKISEQLVGYSSDVKMVADSLEIKLEGKTAEERQQEVQKIMEKIWSKL